LQEATAVSDGPVALVTGGSGFVGSAVVRRLLGEGMAVRVLVRPTSSRMALHGLDVELVEGDLRDRLSLREALHGVRFLFHAAADYRLWARNSAELFATNAGGTEAIMEEAMRAGVERVVFTSSVATLAPGNGSAPSAEENLLDEESALGAYKKSKVRAEKAVTKLIACGLPAVIVKPTTPVGPFDVKPTPTGRIIVETGSGRMPGFVDTGLNVVHVDDVAEGHLAALSRGRIGESYILGGQNVPFRDLLAAIAEECGRPAPRMRVPRALAYSIAAMAEARASVTGREPLATLDGVRMARHLMFFSSAKAERELGYTSRPFQEGVRDAVRWFRQAGYLK
jgi:dihydroflavonol-4-reductase